MAKDAASQKAAWHLHQEIEKDLCVSAARSGRTQASVHTFHKQEAHRAVIW